MDIDSSEISEDRFQKLIDLSVQKRYCPHTSLDWDDHPSKDVPWMPFALCTLYDTKDWIALTDRQRIHLSQLELMNVFSVTLAGEHEIQKDLMPLLFSHEYQKESSYLSIFLREEYDHTVMFWKFCNKYRGDIYRAKHFRMHKWQDNLQQDLNSFVQTLIAEEVLTYFNYVIARSDEVPNLVRQINMRHHTDESRHIVMGRQMVGEMWVKFVAERPSGVVNEYRDYVRKCLMFFISSLANVDVYREAGPENALGYKLAFDKYISKNIHEYAPAKRLLEYLAKIGLHQVTQRDLEKT